MQTDTIRPLFSGREIAFLILGPTVIAPIVVFLPFIVLRIAGADVANFGLTGGNFFFWVLVSQGVGLLATLCIVWRRLRKRGLRWSDVGFRKVSVGRALKYIAGYYGFAFVTLILLAVVLSSLGADSTTGSESSKTALYGPLWSNILITVIIAPIVEEILFRGILLRQLLQSMKPVAAISIGALVFAALHFDPVRIIMLLPLAFYLCFMYHRLQSIYPGIMLHMSWNLLVLLVQY